MKSQKIPAGMIRSFKRPLDVCSEVVRKNGNGGYRLKSINFADLLELVKKGDQNAAGELIRRNLGLIILVIRPYLEYNEFEDLFLDAAEGLVKSARSYEEGKGSEFSSWAKKGILDNIAPMVRNSDGIKGLGRRNFHLLKKIWRASESHYLQTGKEPSFEQISEKLISDAMFRGIDFEKQQEIEAEFAPDKIKKVLKAWQERTRFHSLDKPVNEGSKRPKALINFCPSRGPSPEALAIARINLARYLKGLDPIDAQVIVMKMVEEMTFKEIGEKLGFSKQRASQRYTYGMAILKRRSGAIIT
jgi:RNA polymerase sigma factor (sigma-70 family)